MEGGLEGGRKRAREGEGGRRERERERERGGGVASTPGRQIAVCGSQCDDVIRVSQNAKRPRIRLAPARIQSLKINKCQVGATLAE